MRQRENRSWFSAVNVSLIVLVVSALAVTGLVLYQRQKPNIAKTSAATSPTQTTTQPQITPAATPSTASNTNKYLVIKEWGIKIKMADADKLTYTMNGTPNGPPDADAITSYIWLKFNGNIPASDKCRTFGPTVVQATAATNATKIGNYYYGFQGVYANCGDHTLDALRQKIATQEQVLSAIVAD